MEWIDIEQEKPIPRQEVFIKGKFPFETKCTYLETPNGFTFVTSGLKSGIYEIYGITHWMPLPISKK